MKQSKIEAINQRQSNKRQSKKKMKQSIKDRVIRDIKNLLEHEEDYYRPVRVGKFYSSNYIE